MQPTILLLTTLAASVLGQQPTAIITTIPSASGFTFQPSSQSSYRSGISTTTTTETVSQPLGCPALITAFESAIPTPTGALSSYYNSIITAVDVCAAVRDPPSSLASQVSAYQTSLESFFARPSNVESLADYLVCAAEPTASVSLNSAEQRFFAKATEITRCHDTSGATAGLTRMGGAVGLVGVAAAVVALGMA